MHHHFVSLCMQNVRSKCVIFRVLKMLRALLVCVVLLSSALEPLVAMESAAHCEDLFVVFWTDASQSTQSSAMAVFINDFLTSLQASNKTIKSV
jgi:hypothetical protein